MGNLLAPHLPDDEDDDAFPAGEKHEDGRHKTTEAEERGDIRIVCSGCRGRRDSMEDATSIAVRMPLRDDVIGVGIFDGHGGTGAAAAWAGRNLLFIISATDAWRNGDLEAACSEGFLAADAQMRAEGVKGGTTALVVLIKPSEFIVANAGDSRAVLARANKATVLTVDHTPQLPAEQKRIVAAGGRVVRVRGVYRVVAPKLSKVMLSVSRSLGDFSLKDARRAPDDCVITPLPDVTAHRNKAPDDFLILGCDGLWEVVTAAEAVTLLQRIDRPAAEKRPSGSRMRPLSGHLWGATPRRGSGSAVSGSGGGGSSVGSDSRGDGGSVGGGDGGSVSGGKDLRLRSDSLDVGPAARVRFHSEDVKADVDALGHRPEHAARPLRPEQPADLLFCYDSPLYKDVPRAIPRVISRLPPEHRHSMPAMCERLLERALDYGASDNLTCAVVDLRNTIELPPGLELSPASAAEAAATAAAAVPSATTTAAAAADDRVAATAAAAAAAAATSAGDDNIPSAPVSVAVTDGTKRSMDVPPPLLPMSLAVTADMTESNRDR